MYMRLRRVHLRGDERSHLLAVQQYDGAVLDHVGHGESDVIDVVKRPREVGPGPGVHGFVHDGGRTDGADREGRLAVEHVCAEDVCAQDVAGGRRVVGRVEEGEVPGWGLDRG